MKATDAYDRRQGRAWTLHDALPVIGEHAVTVERHAEDLRQLLTRTDLSGPAPGPEFYVLQLVELGRQIAHAEQFTRHALGHAVGAMRDAGASWDDVAKVLGTSRQSAWERFNTYDTLVV